MTTLLERAPERTAHVPERTAPVPGQQSPAVPAPASAPVTRLVLTGALTSADADWLAPRLDALAATTASTVEVDLSGVETVDAAVARLLLRTSWRLGDPGRTLQLVHPRRQVHRVLRFVGAGHLVLR